MATAARPSEGSAVVPLSTSAASTPIQSPDWSPQETVSTFSYPPSLQSHATDIPPLPLAKMDVDPEPSPAELQWPRRLTPQRSERREGGARVQDVRRPWFCTGGLAAVSRSARGAGVERPPRRTAPPGSARGADVAMRHLEDRWALRRTQLARRQRAASGASGAAIHGPAAVRGIRPDGTKAVEDSLGACDRIEKLIHDTARLVESGANALAAPVPSAQSTSPPSSELPLEKLRIRVERVELALEKSRDATTSSESKEDLVLALRKRVESVEAQLREATDEVASLRELARSQSAPPPRGVRTARGGLPVARQERLASARRAQPPQAASDSQPLQQPLVRSVRRCSGVSLAISPRQLRTARSPRGSALSYTRSEPCVGVAQPPKGLMRGSASQLLLPVRWRESAGLRPTPPRDHGCRGGQHTGGAPSPRPAARLSRPPADAPARQQAFAVERLVALNGSMPHFPPAELAPRRGERQKR